MIRLPSTGLGSPSAIDMSFFKNTIIIFRSPINYININAGTVDYTKGEVDLFPVNIVSTSLSNRIEIEATPESNDIVAKENLYIVLDTTGSSQLSLLEDVLVSGSNVSGTNYSPPSSFISNKKYTR